jgi:two-component system OmpR family response regulator
MTLRDRLGLQRTASVLGKRVASVLLEQAMIMVRPNMSVLVVEDDKLLNWSLASSLSKWGFDVQGVFTGSEAITNIEKYGYDAVLLDYQLPDLDGLSVARQVRKSQPDAAILLLTAFQLNELPVDEGLIDDYFNKPLDLQQIHLTLKNLSKARRQGA